MNQRASGILLHPTSLSNPYPIGDLGPAATAFADFMVKSGQRLWQMLPICPGGKENSPYRSLSAFGGNPLLVSPDRLVEQGLLGRQDIELPISGGEGKVNYPAAARLKLRWLKKAFEHFEKNRHGGRQSELDAFARAESFWLEDFSLFSAIQGKEGTSDWTRWNQELRTRQPDAVIRAQKYFANDIRYHQFVQWQFSVQWKELRAYCTSKGIWLIGDVPLFVAHQSADVWAHPGLFKLDADGNPTVVAGVPPDYFSKTGQVWSVPVYRWEALQEQNYSWWIERLRTAFGRFDVNRLDHFIGLVCTYEVSVQAKTAVNGQYQPAGGASFLEAAREALGLMPLIADDLGATTPEVVALLDHFQIPGTRVLQFELGSNLETNSVPPKQHPVKSVVYTGTHDNDTTAGWYRKLPSMQRKALQERLGANNREVVWAMIREALASQANTAIVPAQDLLELGSEARMNFPGIAKGNWQWRLKDGALTQELAQKLRSMTIVHGRLKSGEPRPAPRCQEDDPAPQIASEPMNCASDEAARTANRSRLAPRGAGNKDGGETMTNKHSQQQNETLNRMKRTTEITALFLDIGGVLLTNGWDHHARKRAATNFKLELAEMEDRHHLTFDTYEEGKLSLEEYLGRVVFYQKRPFTRAQFRRFMFAQSKPYPEMIELARKLKAKYGLKIVVVSNEGRELNSHRIRKFKLDGFVDSFISSCFVHVRKPDADLFRLALDIAQTPAGQIVYIENTPMFVQIAEGFGIRSILHTDYRSTCAKLASFGLQNDEGVIHETS